MKIEKLNGNVIVGKVTVGSKVMEIFREPDDEDEDEYYFCVDFCAYNNWEVEWFYTFDEAVHSAINDIATAMDVMEDICHG